MVPSTPKALIASFKEDLAQIVVVRTFAVNDVAEQARTNKIEDQQFVIIVAAILHQHTMPPCPFGRVNEFPAVLQRVG